jgi:hypothetical protein
LVGTASAIAQAGVTTEGPFTVFRADPGEVLLSLALPLDAPPPGAGPLLRFDFGFATDELDAPGTFFDSFSVTLQNQDRSATALLVTADRTGVEWAPANPGGLAIDPGQVERVPTPFPALNPALALRMAFSVSFLLPAALAGQPLTLFLDLFSNLDEAVSMAFVQGVRIESAPAGVRLFSAPAVTGPFAEETGAVWDEPGGVFTLAAPSGHRFFRLQAGSATRITSIRRVGAQVIVAYRAEVPDALTLLSAATVQGPFVVNTNAVWNPAGRTFTLPRPDGLRVFRISGNRLTRIAAIRVSGADLVIDYVEVALALQSASGVTGSYADEASATLDQGARTWRLSRPGGDRFYRIRSEVRTRIVRIRVEGGEVLVEYELSP